MTYPLTVREKIEAYYVAQAPECDSVSVCTTVQQIISKMEEMVMPEQEIISILLPVDHPLNSQV